MLCYMDCKIGRRIPWSFLPRVNICQQKMRETEEGKQNQKVLNITICGVLTLVLTHV